MKLTKFRKKGKKQLEEDLMKERKELSELYFDVRSGKEKDYAQIKLHRKNIARILTVLNVGSMKMDEKKKESLERKVGRGKRAKVNKSSFKGKNGKISQEK